MDYSKTNEITMKEDKRFFMGCPVIIDTSMKPGEWRLEYREGGRYRVIRSNPPTKA